MDVPGTKAVAAQLIVTLTPDGNVQVAGPLDNPILCYGLLEYARDAIKNHNQPRVMPVPGPLPPTQLMKF